MAVAAIQSSDSVLLVNRLACSLAAAAIGEAVL